MRHRHYKTQPDLEQVRRRLFHIAMNGEDKDSVNAARILLRDDTAEPDGPDGTLLADVRDALLKENL